MNLSERVYRVLVKAYPAHYRTRYAEPMEQLFRDRLREAHTFAERTLLWMRTLADWAVTVPARCWEGFTPHVPQLSLLDSGRRCLFFASREASSFSRNEITLEHLLLGILRQEPSLVANSETVVRAIEASEPAGRRIPPMEDLRLGGQTVRVWVGAQEFARAAGRQVTPKDLVEGILREPESLAARLLREHSRP